MRHPQWRQSSLRPERLSVLPSFAIRPVLSSRDVARPDARRDGQPGDCRYRDGPGSFGFGSIHRQPASDETRHGRLRGSNETRWIRLCPPYRRSHALCVCPSLTSFPSECVPCPSLLFFPLFSSSFALYPCLCLHLLILPPRGYTVPSLTTSSILHTCSLVGYPLFSDPSRALRPFSVLPLPKSPSCLLSLSG
jgi:hypothetical protein